MAGPDRARAAPAPLARFGSINKRRRPRPASPRFPRRRGSRAGRNSGTRGRATPPISLQPARAGQAWGAAPSAPLPCSGARRPVGAARARFGLVGCWRWHGFAKHGDLGRRESDSGARTRLPRRQAQTCGVVGVSPLPAGPRAQQPGARRSGTRPVRPGAHHPSVAPRGRALCVPVAEERSLLLTEPSRWPLAAGSGAKPRRRRETHLVCLLGSPGSRFCGWKPRRQGSLLGSVRCGKSPCAHVAGLSWNLPKPARV